MTAATLGRVAARVQPQRAAGAAALAAGAIAPFVCAAAIGEFGNTVLVQVAIAMITVAGLHALVHWAGQLSLAHAALMGIGAFVTARANGDFGVPLPLAVLTGVGASVIASAAIGVPALRIRGFALAIATLAFSFAASRWLFVQPWLVPQEAGVPLRTDSLLGFRLDRSSELIIPVGLLAVAVLWLTHAVSASSFGRALRLSAHDDEVAASFGIDVAAHKLAAFMFAGACAGLAGALTLLSIGRLGPGAFPLTDSVQYLSAVLLGGAGPAWGSVQAAAVFAGVPAYARGLGRYVDLVGPLAVVVVVVLSPSGLNGLARSLRERLSVRSVPTAPEDGGAR